MKKLSKKKDAMLKEALAESKIKVYESLYNYFRILIELEVNKELDRFAFNKEIYFDRYGKLADITSNLSKKLNRFNKEGNLPF